MAKQSKIKIIDESNGKLEAHEYEWPAHVCQVETEGWDALSITELRVMLAMLGLDPEAQPKDRAKAVSRLEDLITDDTVRGQAAFEMICHHKLPAGTVPIPSGGKWTGTDFLAEARKLIDTVKSDLSREAVEHLITANMAQADAKIAEHVKAALATSRVIEVKLPDEKKGVKIKGVPHEKFEQILKIVSLGLPVLLCGPTQSGKTTIARQIAESLKLRFAAQSFSGGLTESKLLGRVLPRENGKAKFVGTPFLDMYENGGAFLADEIDAADANVFTVLNMGIANGEIWLADRDEKPQAKMHKDFRLIAAANTFGFGADSRYVGRNALDYATIERFGCGVIYMDYDKRIEASLARKEICDWAWALRDRIRKAQLEREMTTRTIAVLEKLTVAYGYGVKEWEERFYANWSAEERRLLNNAPAATGWN